MISDINKLIGFAQKLRSNGLLQMSDTQIEEQVQQHLGMTTTIAEYKRQQHENNVAYDRWRDSMVPSF